MLYHKVELILILNVLNNPDGDKSNMICNVALMVSADVYRL